MRLGINDEHTFAVIAVDKTSGVAAPSQIKKRLKRAVVSWVNDTEEGTQAYANAGGLLNVGDLIEPLRTCPRLQAYLREVGLHQLAVVYHGSWEGRVQWEYDDELVDQSALRKSLQRP